MTGYLVDLGSDYMIDTEDNDFILEFEREKNNWSNDSVLIDELDKSQITNLVNLLKTTGICYDKNIEDHLELHAMDILLRLLKRQGKLLYEIETPEFGGFICNIRVTCNEVFN